jgi:hypothetical protein
MTKNYIHVETSPDRSAGSAVQAYKNSLDLFNKRQEKRRIARLDNETSGKLETYLTVEHHLELEFVPPGTHRALKADRAIETWKEHFISTLAGTDPEFPMQLWDELVEQAEWTLDIHRTPTLLSQRGNIHTVHTISKNIHLHQLESKLLYTKNHMSEVHGPHMQY